MTDSERLSNVIEWSGLSANQFAKEVGYDRAMTLYHVLKPEGRPISSKLATNICNKFQQINRTWLLTGEGNMLKTDINKVGDRVKKLRIELGLTQGQMAKDLGTTEMIIDEIEKGIRQINISQVRLLEINYLASKNWILQGLGDVFIKELPDVNGGITSEQNQSINQLKNYELMTPERFDRLIAIMEHQQESIDKLVENHSKALDNQRILASKIPSYNKNLGENRSERAATS